jgi:hypothetical protein
MLSGRSVALVYSAIRHVTLPDGQKNSAAWTPLIAHTAISVSVSANLFMDKPPYLR